MLPITIGGTEQLSIPSNTFTREGYNFTGWNTKADGTGTSYAVGAEVTLTSDITLYAQWEAPKDTGIADGHEWVDLGLPSGTKWATCNVGASSPEERGDYFTWGETTTKNNYIGSNASSSYYPSTLYLSQDAAYVNWGSSWRMPTKEEIDELVNTSYTTWTWTTQNGVEGIIITSKTNGNSIFLRAAGNRRNYDLINAGLDGYYWSSSDNTTNHNLAYCLHYSEYLCRSSSCDLGYGCTIRPVLRE